MGSLAFCTDHEWSTNTLASALIPARSWGLVSIVAMPQAYRARLGGSSRGGFDDRARDPAHPTARRIDPDQPLDRRQGRRGDVGPHRTGVRPGARAADRRG